MALKNLSSLQRNIVNQALRIMEDHRAYMTAISCPEDFKAYLRLKYAGEEREVFVVVLLDVQRKIMDCVELFAGTLAQTSVYPREVAKLALVSNASAVAFCHNHPSGNPEPSRADISLTSRLKEALALIDVSVIDHVVVGTDGAVSLAERGLV